jgi:hypothetical protein
MKGGYFFSSIIILKQLLKSTIPTQKGGYFFSSIIILKQLLKSTIPTRSR